MCRARNRDYQRRRQNIQGRHKRLDEELLEAQLSSRSVRMFKSLSHLILTLYHSQTSFSHNVVKFDEDTVLTPGARLCAVRDCTFIIPPLDEYRWKTCAVCRFRKQSRTKRPPADESQKSSGQDATDSVLILKLLVSQCPLLCWTSLPNLGSGSLSEERLRAQGLQMHECRLWNAACRHLVAHLQAVSLEKTIYRKWNQESTSASNDSTSTSMPASSPLIHPQ